MRLSTSFPAGNPHVCTPFFYHYTRARDSCDERGRHPDGEGVTELIDQLLANNFQPHFALDETTGDL